MGDWGDCFLAMLQRGKYGIQDGKPDWEGTRKGRYPSEPQVGHPSDGEDGNDVSGDRGMGEGLAG